MQFDELLELVAAVAGERTRYDETLALEDIGPALNLRLGELQSGPAQALHDAAVLLVGEEVDDAGRNLFAHLFALAELLGRGGHHGVHAAEVGGQVFGRGLADEPDAQREQHAVERHLARAGDAAHDVFGRLVA